MTLMNPTTITVEATVNAPIATVWHHYNTPASIMQWNAASDDWHTVSSRVDLRPGGEFSSRMEAKDGSMGFDFAGTYTKVVENELIEYAFGERQAKVEFTVVDGRTHVRVTFDPEQVHPAEMQREGWRAILNHFKRFTESQ